jgi:hypothetical protein
MKRYVHITYFAITNVCCRNLPTTWPPRTWCLIVSFFYNGPSSLAVMFPDVFAGEVPPVAVCLAATVVPNFHGVTCLLTNDDCDSCKPPLMNVVQQISGKDQKFEYQGYSKIYAQFYSMQLMINKDLKHAVKTQVVRIGWVNSAE